MRGRGRRPKACLVMRLRDHSMQKVLVSPALCCRQAHIVLHCSLEVRSA